jgi:outer membrane protein assembly factor BamB
VYCLDLSGGLKWKFNSGNSIEASPVILDGMVYIGNLDGKLFTLDLESGQKQWEYASENQINGSVNWIEINRQTRLFVGSYDYNLHCVDASTGKGLWKYESDNFINGTPTLYKGTAVFGGCDGFLHMVDLETGELRDRIDLATYIAGSAAVSGSLAFIGDYDGMFHCVDMEKKLVAWQWKEEDTYLPFIASPAISGKYVITGNENKYIYCLNVTDGSEKWKVNTRARVHASAVIAGNRVLAANLRGDIFLIGLETGKILLEYELGSPVVSNPAVYNEKIIIGAGDGMVHCLGKK